MDLRPSQPHRGFYHHRLLPHLDGAGLEQHITYRLADSLPKAACEQMLAHLADLPEEQRHREKRQRLEALLDAGYGSCVLRDPAAAQIVIDSWRHFDGERYDLLAWVVMPNHCHVLVKLYPETEIGALIRSWKSFTARLINALPCRTGVRQSQAQAPAGPLWHREYWDRFIRDEQHYERVIAYIEDNPVTAGLCRQAEEWPFSSATKR